VQLKSIQQLIQTTKFNDAIEQSEQLLKQTSEQQSQIELWYLIAVAQRYNKDFSKALTSINALLKLDEKHSQAYQEQGHINFALRQPTQAKLSFKNAVKGNPSLVASWQELIELYRVSKQQKELQII
jgi:tetratricopeptide (TPR) repeat protein